MNWKDVIIRSIEWALLVSVTIFSGTIIMYGALTVAVGVFKGIISYIVLGLILLIVGLAVIHLMLTLIGYHIDSTVDDRYQSMIEDKDNEA